MRILYSVIYAVYVIGTFLSGVAPAWLGYAVARAAGLVAYWLLPARRRVLAANHAPVLHSHGRDPRLRRVGQAAFVNFARYIYEFLRMSHATVDEIDSRVTLHIKDHFEEARQLQRGMIFVSAHFGNMDYAGIAAAKRIVPLTIVADPLKPQRLMDRLVEVRGRKGLTIVYLNKAPRAILQALKRNEAVGFLLDVGRERKGGVPVTFFGRRTMFPAGPALLALRTGAPIVVGYAVVNGDNRIDAYAYPPIYVKPSGNKERDVRYWSQLITNYFEDFIARYPEQWYIFRPMWQTMAQSEPQVPIEEVSLPEALTETAG